MNKNVLGTRLAELRGDRKWNQAELGRQLGVSRSHISRIESGDTKNVSSELLVKIAKLFRVSTDYLLGMTQEDMIQAMQRFAQQAMNLDDEATGHLGKLCDCIMNEAE